MLHANTHTVFFTYMINAPIMVYGVANLILSLVSVGGIFIFITVNINNATVPHVYSPCPIAGRSTCPHFFACHFRMCVHRISGRICQFGDIHYRPKQLSQPMCQ